MTSALVALSALLFTGFAPQTPTTQTAGQKPKVTNAWTYKVGDTDTYKIEMKANFGGQSSTVGGTMTHKVTKLLDEGGAEIVETPSSVTTSGNLPAPPVEPQTLKLDSFGVFQGKMPNAPFGWHVVSIGMFKIDDLNADKDWKSERDLSGVTVKLTGKVTDKAVPLYEITFEGSFAPGAGMPPGNLKGVYVWDSKIHRYAKGSFTIMMKGDKPEESMSMTFGFERQPDADKK